MPTCFVIMPLTTPPSMVQDYGGDDQHFIHVLDHLFIPAIRAAEYEPIKPIMRGGDLIHAEIIRNLEEADLVLCDVSALNANVFFELGIRTALDRPVTMVKDDRTATYPFDTSMINYHSYNSSLAAWTLPEDVQLLSQHIRDSGARASGRNSLWRYFGLTQRAAPAVIENPVEEKLDLLVSEVEKLKATSRPAAQPSVVRRRDFLNVEALRAGVDQVSGVPIPDEKVRNFLIAACQIADEADARLVLEFASPRDVILDPTFFDLDYERIVRIMRRGAKDGIAVGIRNAGRTPTD